MLQRRGKTMSDFQLHDAQNAPPGSGELLDKVNESFGFTPNLTRVLAGAPAALRAYLTLGETFDGTSLSPREQQAVLLSVSFENGCAYCIAAHSMVGRMKGLSEGEVEALRTGEPLSDPQLNAVSRFTRAVVRERGSASADEVKGFLDAGFTRQSILEVLVGVTMKTLSNYTNHLADTPLDDAFAEHAWEHQPESAVAR